MMYKRYIQQSLAYILLLLGAIFLFPHITFALEKQESVITSPDEEPRQVQIIPRSTLSKEQTKELLTGKEYISATLTSVIDLGKDEITDGDKWCYFTVNNVPSHTMVSIYDTLNVWDRGDNYPYWYYEKNN